MFKIKQNHWSNLALIAFVLLMFFALNIRIEKINQERSSSQNHLQDFVIR